MAVKLYQTYIGSRGFLYILVPKLLVLFSIVCCLCLEHPKLILMYTMICLLVNLWDQSLYTSVLEGGGMREAQTSFLSCLCLLPTQHGGVEGPDVRMVDSCCSTQPSKLQGYLASAGRLDTEPSFLID